MLNFLGGLEKKMEISEYSSSGKYVKLILKSFTYQSETWLTQNMKITQN